MNSFNYEVLNDKEFELLACDILEIEMSLSFRSFKSGRDGGVDLRFSSISDKNNIIVQVKHYTKSPYSQLKYTLKSELEKVKKLSPKRYIIVTSLELKASEVDEICEMFKGYVLNAQDILFKQTIDKVLSNNKELVKKYYKLWLSSTSVINTILHNDVIGRSKMLFNEISSYLPLYVHVEEHQDALKELLESKVLIITGPPGIGKSTLAKILLYQLISTGDFELIEVTRDLQEASNIIDYNSGRKQVIFFDDFLGANLLEVINPKNSASSISLFINRIKSLKGKYLIMTSRTTILNQAAYLNQRLKNLKEDDTIQHVIQLKDYSRFEKARILYNHIYFQSVDYEYFNAIKSEAVYLDIIDHKSYSPRLIEFLTSSSFISNSTPQNYIQRIKYSLNNPEELWEESYLHNIDEGQRFLLQTLLTFSGSAPLNILKKAFQSRLNVQTQNYGFTQTTNLFNRSIKALLGGYLNSQISQTTNIQTISFSNPSIGDFLRNYLSVDSESKRAIALSCKYFEQLLNLIDIFKDLTYGAINDELFEKNVNLDEEYELCFEKEKELSNEDLNIWYTYLQIFPNRISDWVKYNFDYLIIYDWTYEDFDLACSVLRMLSDYDFVKKIVVRRWEELAEHFYDCSYSEQSFIGIRQLFDAYEIDYNTWYRLNSKIVDHKLSDFFTEQIRYSLLNDSFDFEYSESSGSEFWEVNLETDLEEVADELLEDSLSNSGIFNSGDQYNVDLKIDYESAKSKIEQKFKEQVYEDEMAVERYRDENFRMDDLDKDNSGSDEAIHSLFE